MSMMNSNLPIRRITIHTTDTPPGIPQSVQQIRQMHLDRGWDDIGYHYLIGLKGEIGLGRKESTVPAAVKGHNQGMIAIAYVGGQDKDGKGKDTRTPEQKRSIAQMVWLVAHKYGVAASNILGHRDLDYIDKNHDGKPEPDEWLKLCPCFDVSSERDEWLRSGGDRP